MHNKLQEIYDTKLREVEDIQYSENQVRKVPIVKFTPSIKAQSDIALIAEIKKASPSKGIIRENFDLIEIIDSYNSFPANAISVLTDQQYFQGHTSYLKQVKDLTKLPILRKDFIVDKKQIYESFYLGADLILLIVALLSSQELKEFITIANNLGLECLVETHNKDEIEIALAAGAEIIGVNNRDLNTFEVDIKTAIDLAPSIPENIIKIAESGLHDAEDIKKMQNAGYDGVLIGEAFMKSADLIKTYRDLFCD